MPRPPQETSAGWTVLCLHSRQCVRVSCFLGCVLLCGASLWEVSRKGPPVGELDLAPGSALSLGQAGREASRQAGRRLPAQTSFLG